MLGACHPFDDKGHVKICLCGASPILVYGGALCESSPSEAQGKGMILIGFLFYRSHDVNGETGL